MVILHFEENARSLSFFLFILTDQEETFIRLNFGLRIAGKIVMYML